MDKDQRKYNDEPLIPSEEFTLRAKIIEMEYGFYEVYDGRTKGEYIL